MRAFARPCVCGTDVTANPDDPTPGVQEHNASFAHKRWRKNRVKVERTREWNARLRADVELVRMQRWARKGAA